MIPEWLNSIRWKLVVPIGFAAIVILSTVAGFTVMTTSAQVTSLTEQRMEQKAQAQANYINSDMKEKNTTATSLASTMEEYDKESASRQEVNDMLDNVAMNNPDVLGVYLAYEPNAFDGNDAEHVNDTGSNEAGRFAPYWNRFDGSLGVSPLKDLDSQDWYTRPVKERRPVIKGPFIWGDKYMISFLVPIERDGEVIGVAGVDMSINYWQNQTQEADIAGDGYAFIASEDGTFVAHPNTTLVGEKTIADVGNRDNLPGFRGMQDQIQRQESGSLRVTDPVTGERAMVQYHSVETGDFVYATVVPQDTALAGVHSMRNTLIGVSGVSLILLIGIIFVGTRRIARPIEAVTNKSEMIRKGDYDVDLRSDRGDEIGTLFESLATMRDSLVSNIEEAREAQERAQSETERAQTAKQEATDAKKEAEQARQEAEELSSHLQEKAADFSTTMSNAADGDFTQRMDPESRTDAMTEIAEGFNQMMVELEETFSRIRSFADEVAASSEEVTAGAEESQSASEQVSESIQEIATDADMQSENLQEVVSQIQTLSGTIEEVASSADEIARTSQQTASIGEEGREAASAAMNEMDAIEAQSAETIDEIESLAAEIREIGEIVELITEIAEQTNILALNASIEAANAGKAGEGFAVVASEIKQLATEVGEATDEVENRIDEIQSSTSSTVDNIQEMGDRIASGTTTIEDALDALEEIASNVEGANQGIQEISAATDDQARSAEEVAGMIDEVTESAAKVSEESGNVSAAAEEQTSSLTQVSNSSQRLAEQADELRNSLSTFTIATDQVDANAPDPTQPAATDGGPKS